MGTHKVFLREATGLVRTFTWLDAFVISTAGLLAGLWGYGGMMGFIGFAAPGADIAGSADIAFLFLIPMALVYTLLASSMPRSGGDYVWITRLVHPVLGFISTWGLWISVLATVGVDALLFPTVILPVTFASLGYGLNDAGLLSLASLVCSNSTWIFGLGFVLLGLSFLIVAFGPKMFHRIMLTMFVLSMVSLVVSLIVLAGFTHADFVNAVNGYGGTNITYDGIIEQAKSGGWSFVPLTFTVTLMGVPAAIIALNGFNYSAAAAGEVRSVRKSMVAGVLGALAFGWLTNVVGAQLTMNVVGYDFYQAALAMGSNWPLAAPPWAPLFIAMLIPHNIPILAIIQIGWLLSFFWNSATFLLVATRYVFAFSFDRVFPAAMAEINERFHLPLKATILNFVVTVIFLILATYTPWLGLFLNAVAIFSIVWILASISAIILPYKKKEVAKSLPGANWKVPLISIAGTVSLVTMLIVLYFSVTVPALGPSTPGAFAILVAIFVVGLIVYFANYSYHKARGVDLKLIYSEIPPE